MSRRGTIVCCARVDAAAHLGWPSDHGLANRAGNGAQQVCWRTCPRPRLRQRQQRNLPLVTRRPKHGL
jgi:hypothetical protein